MCYRKGNFFINIEKKLHKRFLHSGCMFLCVSQNVCTLIKTQGEMKLHKLYIFVTSISFLLNVFNIICGSHSKVQIQFLVR